MAKAIRKQVYHLTLEDFDAVPVWEFASDGEGVAGRNEATVRPYEASFPIDPGHGGLLVRAVFILTDGAILRGYLSPQPMSLRRPGYLQPVMICGTDQLNFWSGIRRPTKEQMIGALAKLRKQAAQVFPLEYRSDVELVGVRSQARSPDLDSSKTKLTCSSAQMILRVLTEISIRDRELSSHWMRLHV
jgi:hypothetical protein